MYNFRFYKCNKVEYYSVGKKPLEEHFYGRDIFCQGYIKLYFNERVTLDQYTIIGKRLFQIGPVIYSPFIILMRQTIDFKEGDGIFTTNDIEYIFANKKNNEFWGNYLAEQQDIDLQKINLVTSGINLTI